TYMAITEAFPQRIFPIKPREKESAIKPIKPRESVIKPLPQRESEENLQARQMTIKMPGEGWFSGQVEVPIADMVEDGKSGEWAIRTAQGSPQVIHFSEEGGEKGIQSNRLKYITIEADTFTDKYLEENPFVKDIEKSIED